MLYDRARLEPLRDIPWDEELVRQTIEHIVADAEEHFTSNRYWPTHPLDVGGDEGLRKHLRKQGRTKRGMNTDEV